MDQWYVAHTKAHEENKALFHLQRQGFQTYLPRYRKSRRHARRVETVVCPLFPRYLFIRMDVACTQWRSVASTVGVSHLICRDGVPARVPDSVIAEITAREDAEGYVHVNEDVSLRTGQAVVVVDGPLASSTGFFEACSDRRVLVLLDFLGRQVRANLSKEALAPSN